MSYVDKKLSAVPSLGGYDTYTPSPNLRIRMWLGHMYIAVSLSFFPMPSSSPQTLYLSFTLPSHALTPQM